MLQNQCINDRLWLEAGERLYRSQEHKEFSLAKSLGLKYFSLKNYSKAGFFFDDAISLAPSDRDKGEMLLYAGRVVAIKDRPAARKIYREVLTLNKGNKEAYERIGDLYYDSYEECGDEEDKVRDLLVYFLAADYYQRSGNDTKVKMVREKFPTKGELAAVGYQDGAPQSVRCWIEESTTVKAKD